MITKKRHNTEKMMSIIISFDITMIQTDAIMEANKM